jgi:hypothetical protein
MFCPLRSAISSSSRETVDMSMDGFPAPCVKDQCAWWMSSRERCAVTELSCLGDFMAVVEKIVQAVTFAGLSGPATPVEGSGTQEATQFYPYDNKVE